MPEFPWIADKLDSEFSQFAVSGIGLALIQFVIDFAPVFQDGVKSKRPMAKDGEPDGVPKGSRWIASSRPFERKLPLAGACRVESVRKFN